MNNRSNCRYMDYGSKKNPLVINGLKNQKTNAQNKNRLYKMGNIFDNVNPIVTVQKSA